jgi:hypothetical protein
MIRARTTQKPSQPPISLAASLDDDDAQDRKRRRRRRKLGPIHPLKLCAATSFSIGMMVFMALVDFQPANKIVKEPLIHKVLKRTNITADQEAKSWPAPHLNATYNVCWFDSHCPDRHVCSPTEDGFASCIPYYNLETENEAIDPEDNRAPPACVDACTAELRQHVHPNDFTVEASYSFSSDSYPSGCRLLFKSPDAHDVQPLLLDNNNTRRFQHIQRVDHYLHDTRRWMALCTHPCHADSDCSTRTSNTAFVCPQPDDGGSFCQRNPRYWPAATTTNNHTTMITTASYYLRGA